MTRDEIIGGFEREIRRIRREPKEKMLGVCITVDEAEEIVELLKEQEAEPGHWVVLENCSNAGVYCSECNTKIFDHYPMKKKYSYFCPHCGTRMEGQAVKWDD